MPRASVMPDGVVSAPVYDDLHNKPEPDQHAPRGYTWNRQSRQWVPKVKGRTIYQSGDPVHEKPQDAPQAAAPAGDVPQGDPDPGWFADNADQPQAADGKKRLRLEDVPQAVRDDIAGFAGLVGAPVLAMLQQADPYCGTILAQSFEPIVDACLPLICRSEKIVRYFTGDQSDWLLWGKLAMALAPVAKAVIAHHVTKTVEVVRDPSGQVQVMPRRPGPAHGDHLTPPQPEPAYAA